MRSHQVVSRWTLSCPLARHEAEITLSDLQLYSTISFCETLKFLTKPHKLEYNSFTCALCAGFKKCSLWQRFLKALLLWKESKEHGENLKLSVLKLQCCLPRITILSDSFTSAVWYIKHVPQAVQKEDVPVQGWAELIQPVGVRGVAQFGQSIHPLHNDLQHVADFPQHPAWFLATKHCKTHTHTVKDKIKDKGIVLWQSLHTKSLDWTDWPTQKPWRSDFCLVLLLLCSQTLFHSLFSFILYSQTGSSPGASLPATTDGGISLTVLVLSSCSAHNINDPTRAKPEQCCWRTPSQLQSLQLPTNKRVEAGGRLHRQHPDPALCVWSHEAPEPTLWEQEGFKEEKTKVYLPVRAAKQSF